MNTEKLSAFDRLVLTRYNIYNGLFLNLSYTDEDNVGHLLPLLKRYASDGLAAGANPRDIIDGFFDEQFGTVSEQEKLDFMFKAVQFIERQVVLYDSIEDSAFPSLLGLRDSLSLKDLVQIAKNGGKSQAIIDKLNEFAVRITFTAHPTQFYPRSILEIIADLRTLIPENRINEVDSKLHQLGLTSMLNRDKPTPLDEAKNIIRYMRSVYYDSIAVLYGELKATLGPAFDNPRIVQLGFWPCGDRDGNPFVTHEITRDVADELRMELMKCYYKDVKELARTLTFKSLAGHIDALRSGLYKAMFNRDHLISKEEILASVDAISDELTGKYHSLFIDELEAFRNKVNIFGTHFACMDIRQDHSVHERTVSEILKTNGFIRESLDELDEDQLIKILIEETPSLNTFNSTDKLVEDTLKTIGIMRGIQETNGLAACERYIISNSEDIWSVLFVFALLRWAGKWENEIDVDVIPLFETMEGMRNSEGIMRKLFAIPEYAAHVKRRSSRQTMMLGFSDGTKDGGYLQANWSIFKTKETLSKVCEEQGVSAVFFDGRGGPPARGGGKTHRFYAAQSDRIANNEIQITIQGQTITSTYGTRDQFNYNSRQMIAAGLHNELYGAESQIAESDRNLMEELALLSFEKYDSLKQHERFIPYLEEKSTLKYYAKANIGSRPAKRGGDRKLTLSDLRAISFVGSWSQLKQNVPGYFGIGSALQKLKEEGRLEEVKNLFADVPVFRALILNSMMSLAKTNFNLTRYMSEDPDYGGFWEILFDEYELTRELALEISGQEELMKEEPFSRASVEAREGIVLPLLLVQQYGLMRIQDNDEYKAKYEKLVTRSLYGNINASRNSA